MLIRTLIAGEAAWEDTDAGQCLLDAGPGSVVSEVVLGSSSLDKGFVDGGMVGVIRCVFTSKTSLLSFSLVFFMLRSNRLHL